MIVINICTPYKPKGSIEKISALCSVFYFYHFWP